MVFEWWLPNLVVWEECGERTILFSKYSDREAALGGGWGVNTISQGKNTVSS